jgi:hypothetical protein
MSLRRELEARLKRAALHVLDAYAPGAAEVVHQVEQWERGRAPIEATDERAAGSGGPSVASDGDGDGDTVAVEITDERGRCVGWTTATVKR